MAGPYPGDDRHVPIGGGLELTLGPHPPCPPLGPGPRKHLAGQLRLEPHRAVDLQVQPERAEDQRFGIAQVDELVEKPEQQQIEFEKLTDMHKDKSIFKIYFKIHDVFGISKKIKLRPRHDETVTVWEIVMK